MLVGIKAILGERFLRIGESYGGDCTSRKKFGRGEGSIRS
jgi:hypothetical protein